MSIFRRLADHLTQHHADLSRTWSETLLVALASRKLPLSAGEVAGQCATILSTFAQALAAGGEEDITTRTWGEMREALQAMSRQQVQSGFSASDTARFIFSLKAVVFPALREIPDGSGDPHGDLLRIDGLIDALGLFTTECFIAAREGVIRRQQDEMLELSTPVVSLWEGVLALPLIGTLDSARTQVVMESLLEKVVQTGCEVAIIDITGVPTVDTLVAQHLLKTVTAARLMGTDCIISGIRPQIAQTIVHLGVDLSHVITKSSLADAFQIALHRLNLAITRVRPASSPATAGHRSDASGALAAHPSVAATAGE
jgi:rsbT co-antagonist protein RsbR